MQVIKSFTPLFLMGKGMILDYLKNPKSEYILPNTKAIVDTGYQDLKKNHANSQIRKKKTKKSLLSKEGKKYTQQLSSQRIANENLISPIIHSKVISDRYRNRYKRFVLRGNLISRIYN